MNRAYYVLMTLALLAVISCKKQKEEPKSLASEGTIEMETPKTYAEISVAQGGEWKDRVYENGTSFKNVDELWVPKSHTDHSWYIRYEGPGWESNKVGYRLYLDWRNAIDIYGKVTDSLILQNVGQDGFDSYHERQSWGQDILKVGKGLGVGSLGRYVNGEVLHFNEVDSTFAKVTNTVKESSAEVEYKGWKTDNEKIDLASTLSIKPDSRVTKHTFAASKAISGICTGIVDHEVDYFTNVNENGQWAYIATYGEQTLVPDKLGMAVFYKIDTAEETVQGQHDHLVVFKSTTDPITIYFLGAWEQEKNGITNKDAFVSYLDGLLDQLNNSNEL